MKVITLIQSILPFEGLGYTENPVTKTVTRLARMSSFSYNLCAGAQGYSEVSEISQGICELLLSDWLREKKQRDVEADSAIL